MISFLPGLASTSAALHAERIRLDVIAQNIANAHTTRGLDGRPYQRQQVVFETVLRQSQQSGPAEAMMGGPKVSRIQKDPRPFRLVYQPGHPDAGPNGMVSLPNVNLHEEMADMIAASRAFDANLAVLRNARSMALQTLAIGKR